MYAFAAHKMALLFVGLFTTFRVTNAHNLAPLVRNDGAIVILTADGTIVILTIGRISFQV